MFLLYCLATDYANLILIRKILAKQIMIYAYVRVEQFSILLKHKSVYLNSD